jgi:UDP-glucose 4-epimerase
VGPRQTHGVGFDFLKKLKKNPQELEILGDGTQTKSYIHVKDIVSGVLHAEKKSNMFYDVFNISTQDFLSVHQIAKMAIEILGLDESQVAMHFGVGDRGWKGDIPKIQLDSSKLEDMGWRAVHGSYEAMNLALSSMNDEF